MRFSRHFYKRLAHFKSELDLCNKKKTSHSIEKLTFKRNNKINDYLHKASRSLVNQLVSQNVSYLVIGNNRQWKQEISIGKRNNQNFVQIPHSRFIEMLEYKCKMVGIHTTIQEESYTSKCSFLDLEEVKKHDEYMGKRYLTKMFRASDGRVINADVNGSFNIMRKAVSELFKSKEEIEGVVVHPRVLSFNL